MSGAVARYGYDDIDDVLVSCHDAPGAAECHGMLCGLLLCDAALEREQWLQRLASGSLTGEAEEVALDDDELEMLRNWFDDTVRQLNDSQLGFMPYLPDDEAPLPGRAEALAQWCQGFLYGLGLGGLQDFKQLSPQAREFAADLNEISRLADDAAGNEEAETAYSDIVEYVRMGVLLLRDELAPMAHAGGTAATVH